MNVRWHTDEPTADHPEWFGWTDEQDMRVDEPTFVVRYIERDDVWAGWILGDPPVCTTHDHGTARSARVEVEEIS